jgi:hypothetical protein
MKLCPTCNLVETDDALRFCRADGTTLISYSGPIGAEAGWPWGYVSIRSSQLGTSINSNFCETLALNVIASRLMRRSRLPH